MNSKLLSVKIFRPTQERPKIVWSPQVGGPTLYNPPCLVASIPSEMNWYANGFFGKDFEAENVSFYNALLLFVAYDASIPPFTVGVHVSSYHLDCPGDI